MNEQNTCIFCQSIRNVKDLVYQDTNTVAFLDIFPITNLHCLIVPRNHSKQWITAPSEDIANTYLVAQKIAQTMVQSFPDIDGFNLVVNNGKEAGQMIDHYHLHLIPHWKGNGPTLRQNAVDDIAKQKLDTNRTLLKQLLI